MAEPHTAIEAEQQVEAHAPYMKVFWALLVFTIAEYFYAMMTQKHFTLLVVGLMAMAITKATLVGMYFMHLKFEGRWVYALLVPAAFLALALVTGVWYDIANPPIGAPIGPDVEPASSKPAMRAS